MSRRTKAEIALEDIPAAAATVRQAGEALVAAIATMALAKQEKRRAKQALEDAKVAYTDALIELEDVVTSDSLSNAVASRVALEIKHMRASQRRQNSPVEPPPAPTTLETDYVDPRPIHRRADLPALLAQEMQPTFYAKDFHRLLTPIPPYEDVDPDDFVKFITNALRQAFDLPRYDQSIRTELVDGQVVIHWRDDGIGAEFSYTIPLRASYVAKDTLLDACVTMAEMTKAHWLEMCRLGKDEE